MDKKYKHIVIIGGGFAGTALARKLERQIPETHRLILISKDNFITYNPLLAEVVGASIPPAHAVAPVRQIAPKTRFYMVNVTDIDVENKEIHYLGEGSGVIAYDQLIVACGTDAAVDLVKGMSDYALPLKTLGDALFLRNRIMIRLEQAELQRDPVLRKWLMTFVIIGGGFSGVEVAGEIQDLLRSSLRYYHNIAEDDCKVILLHSRATLLQELPESLGVIAAQKMRHDGIDIITNTRVSRVTDRGVQLSGDTDLPKLISAGTVINTIGTRPNKLVELLDVEKVKARIKVNPDMSVPDRDGIWALGDCAAVPNISYGGELCAPTAQFADRQGKLLAGNIVARLQGEATRPFEFVPLGLLSTIGHNKAVAEVIGMKFTGLIGFLMWRGVYLMKIPTLARKARLFLEWNWDLFFAQDIVYLRFSRSKRKPSVDE